MGRSDSLAAMLEEEQAELAALASALTGDQWAAPSLCLGWSVEDVIVHVTAHGHRSLRETLGRDLAERRLRAVDRAVLLDTLRSPVRASVDWDRRLQLAELVIHHQDVRRALGMSRAIPAARLEVVLSSVRTRWVGRLAGVGARARGRGLRLVATDFCWAVGAGAEVRAPGEAILMAIAGRPLGADELAGSGAPTLADALTGTYPRDTSSRSRLSRR